jgi:DNA-binding NarL/FixJ family response regulator
VHIAKQLLRSSPNTRIVLYAGPNDEKLLFDAIRIGVHGYLQKTLSIADLCRSTNKQIGNQMYWSEIQVKRKMQDIYRKLQVTDRAQAVAEAMRHGLI